MVLGYYCMYKSVFFLFVILDMFKCVKCDKIICEELFVDVVVVFKCIFVEKLFDILYMVDQVLIFVKSVVFDDVLIKVVELKEKGDFQGVMVIMVKVQQIGLNEVIGIYDYYIFVSE